jgi:hypothetical protein
MVMWSRRRRMRSSELRSPSIHPTSRLFAIRIKSAEESSISPSTSSTLRFSLANRAPSAMHWSSSRARSRPPAAAGDSRPAPTCRGAPGRFAPGGCSIVDEAGSGEPPRSRSRWRRRRPVLSGHALSSPAKRSLRCNESHSFRGMRSTLGSSGRGGAGSGMHAAATPATRAMAPFRAIRIHRGKGEENTRRWCREEYSAPARSPKPARARRRPSENCRCRASGHPGRGRFSDRPPPNRGESCESTGGAGGVPSFVTCGYLLSECGG